MAYIKGKSIFGEYSQLENRVTAALLHVLNIGGERLIRYIFNETNSGFDLPDNAIKVETQVDKKTDSNSVPDGCLSCNFSFKIWIESKVTCNSINEKQLHNHCKLLETESNAVLLYLTPDDMIPKKLLDKSVAWLNWKTIVAMLKSYNCNDEVLKFLIEQFVLLIDNSKLLLDYEDRVLVVGGCFGEGIAEKYNFYACQAGRSFKHSKYLAFAYNNRIKQVFPILNDPVDDVKIAEQEPVFAKDMPNEAKGLRTYIKLAKPVVLNNEITNNVMDKNGKRCAFTQRQTYVSYKQLNKATLTSQLDRLD